MPRRPNFAKDPLRRMLRRLCGVPRLKARMVAAADPGGLTEEVVTVRGQRPGEGPRPDLRDDSAVAMDFVGEGDDGRLGEGGEWTKPKLEPLELGLYSSGRSWASSSMQQCGRMGPSVPGERGGGEGRDRDRRPEVKLAKCQLMLTEMPTGNN